MLSLLADVMLTATRQENYNRRAYYHDRFVSDPYRREANERRRHNPYSYFQ